MRLCGVFVVLPGLLAGCAGVSSGTAQDDRAVGLRLADATLGAGAPVTALNVSDGLLRANPQDSGALIRRGRALLALHRLSDAAQSFAEAARLAPGDAEALSGLARARAESGDAIGAEAAWRSALKLHPNDATSQAGLAVALDLQDRHDEAQVLYRALLLRLPDAAAVRSDLGLSLALSGRSAEALPLLRQAAEGGSDSRERHNLAVGLALAGDEAAARAVLEPDMGPAAAGAAVTGVRLLAAR